MLISNIIKDSFIDYENEHSMVLFYDKCNLDCKGCYNKGMYGEDKEDIFSILDRELTPLHTAIVLSGGEVTCYAGISGVCKQIKEKYPNLKVKVFTNGMNPTQVGSLIPYVDMFSLDFKTVYSNEITGIPAEVYVSTLKLSLDILEEVKKPYQIRIWKHPLHKEGEVEDIIRYLKLNVNSNINYVITDFYEVDNAK